MTDPVDPIVKMFNRLIATAPAGTFKKPVSLVIDDERARAGRPATDKRAMAATDGNTVFITRAFYERANTGRVEGVLAHELAHVALLAAGHHDHTEREADSCAADLFKVDVGYDDEDVQTSAADATRPRPRRLDARENPGEHSGCVVRSLIENPGTWDIRRIHALFGVNEPIPKDLRDERMYRGVKVELRPSRAVGSSATRGGRGHRIVVHCGCGRVVGFGRMEQHARGGGRSHGQGFSDTGCDYARATLVDPMNLCNCPGCIREGREVDREDCPDDGYRP